MHPYSNREQHDRSEQRPKPFGQLPARAADPDCIGGHHPGDPPGNERADPTAMHVSQRLSSLRLAKERDHGDDDEQGFEPLAQQDRECAQERGRFRGGIRRQRRFRIVEQPVEH